MTVHDLKIARQWFDAIAAGDKTYEVRETVDRHFVEGDIVVLREWMSDPNGQTGQYTGRELIRRVGTVINAIDLTVEVAVFSLLPPTDRTEAF